MHWQHKIQKDSDSRFDGQALMHSKKIAKYHGRGDGKDKNKKALSGLLSCAQITVLGLSNGLVDQQYPHCDKDVAETTLIGGCGHIYAHGSESDKKAPD